MNFLDAVGRTPISQMLQNATWMVSTLQSFHIMALALVFTSAAVVDLRLLGVAERDQPLQKMTSRFLPVVGWGVLVLLLTGILLMMAEPRRAILNPYFQLKMAALVIVSIMTWKLASSVHRDPEHWTKPEAQGAAKGMAIVSLALWAAIIVAGRWIAYGP